MEVKFPVKVTPRGHIVYIQLLNKYLLAASYTLLGPLLRTEVCLKGNKEKYLPF